MHINNTCTGKGHNLSLKSLLKSRIDELENIFNGKVVYERFFVRSTLIINLKILAAIDQPNAELYVLRIRELGFRGTIWE